MFKLEIATKVAKELKKLPKQHRDSIRFVLRELKDDPTIGEPLGRELTGQYSIKIGVYRIVYRVNFKNEVVFVSTAGHRATVYKRVRR